MITNLLFSIVCAIIVWVIAVGFYLTSYYFPILENPEQQANIVLALAIIPSACLGAFLFYKKGKLKPALLALTFDVIATLLDALITVPAFVLPSGGTYSEFFSDIMFYIIAIEFFLTVVYFGNHLSKNNNK